MPDDLTHAKRDDSPEESRRVRLSRTFDEDAELYDRARPGYPPELYDDLADLAGAGPGSRVLEVGSGTGKATVPLAGQGYRITAVEAGAHMAAVARRNLAGNAAVAVEVVTAEFESWPLPEEPPPGPGGLGGAPMTRSSRRRRSTGSTRRCGWRRPPTRCVRAGHSPWCATSM
jgi:SAM-dependent methyltransferase